jgi:hypothetical protein
MGFVSILNTIKSRLGAAWAAFDVRDLLVYGGLISIGYGLYQFRPWLGWTAFGVVSMLLGLGWLFRVRK